MEFDVIAVDDKAQVDIPVSTGHLECQSATGPTEQFEHVHISRSADDSMTEYHDWKAVFVPARFFFGKQLAPGVIRQGTRCVSLVNRSSIGARTCLRLAGYQYELLYAGIKTRACFQKILRAEMVHKVIVAGMFRFGTSGEKAGSPPPVPVPNVTPPEPFVLPVQPQCSKCSQRIGIVKFCLKEKNCVKLLIRYFVKFR